MINERIFVTSLLAFFLWVGASISAQAAGFRLIDNEPRSGEESSVDVGSFDPVNHTLDINDSRLTYSHYTLQNCTTLSSGLICCDTYGPNGRIEGFGMFCYQGGGWTYGPMGGDYFPIVTPKPMRSVLKIVY